MTLFSPPRVESRVMSSFFVHTLADLGDHWRLSYEYKAALILFTNIDLVHFYKLVESNTTLESQRACSSINNLDIVELVKSRNELVEHVLVRILNGQIYGGENLLPLCQTLVKNWRLQK
jgi:hypothetical protein